MHPLNAHCVHCTPSPKIQRGLAKGVEGVTGSRHSANPERVDGEAMWSLCFSSWENHGFCQLLPVALRKSRQQYNQWHVCKSRLKVGKGKERREIMSYLLLHVSTTSLSVPSLQSLRPWVITPSREGWVPWLRLKSID